jgi:peptidoglycan hydrolase CwlO-like protein
MKTQIQYNSEIKKSKTALEEKESEIKRLQKYEEIHPALQAKRDELQKKLDNYGTTLDKANGKIIQLTNELRTAGKEKEELLHRYGFICFLIYK